MILINAPAKINKFKRPAVFLAGSIEMGKAEEWQVRVERELQAYPITIFNPRRKTSDFNWNTNLDNKNFFEQVSWEFKALSASDYIIMYFDPRSKSPISLLELGLFARSQKMFCCCPPKFWRRGNVEFICRQFKIPFFSDLDELLLKFKRKLPQKSA